MSCSAIDIAPFLCIGRTLERHLLLLIRGLLLAVAAISAILTVSRVSHVNYPIILVLLPRPLATGLKESSLGLGGVNAYVSDYEQINHCFWLLHGYLLRGLDIADLIMEAIDDFDVLDVHDNAPGIAETFYVVPKALIILLLDDF
jgi:hypothetical protein